MKSLVTTGRGDSGQTHTLDGDTIYKDHPIMEALGVLDSMKTHIALLRVQLQEQRPEARQETDFLLFLLHTCFLIGSVVSDLHNRKPNYHPVRLNASHLERLEEEHARLEAGLQLPRAFIVCASNALAAQADVTVSAVRTFERRFVALRKESPGLTDSLYSAFINRLSDYFYILARYLDQNRYQVVDYSMVRTEVAPDVNSPSD